MRLNDQDKSALRDHLSRYRGHAQGYHEGGMGFQVKQAYDYYYGMLPLPYAKGGSKFVSRDVWEAVNGTLQDLLSVFASNEDAVEFTPTSPDDALMAKISTSYVNKVILRDNPGYNVLHDAFKEALVARNSFIKRYWMEDINEDEEAFEGVSEDELAVLASQENVTIDDYTKDEDGTYSGTAIITTDESKVVLEFTPFEEILVDPESRSIADCNYFGHRTRKTVQELIDMGFDAKDIKTGAYEADVSADAGEIALSRINYRNPDQDGLFGANVVGDENTERVWLHEEYIRTSIGVKKRGNRGRQRTKLLQVFSLGGTILEVNEVSEIPFETITPFPTPASIFGESVFDITKDIQDVKTALTRGYIDNIMNANYGRYKAVKNQYDRKSLLDNRPGGVVEENAPGMIDRFPYHPIPAGTDSLMEQMEQVKERRTGVTRMGMGLNAEVFKNDNAYATVDMMMSAAQNRMRMVARNIAEDGVKRLYLSIYRLARENDQRPQTVEVQGMELPVIPSQWPERTKMRTAVAVGQGERKERAGNLMNLLNVFTNNPLISGTSFSQQNANYIAKELTQAMGCYDVNNYITNFADIPQPEPSPAEQIALAQAQAELQKTQAQSQEIMMKAQMEAAKIQLERARVQKELAELQFTQERTADEMRVRQEESAANQADKAIAAARDDAEMDIKLQELKLKERELDLKEREIMIEAQLEAMQSRPVGLGND